MRNILIILATLFFTPKHLACEEKKEEIFAMPDVYNSVNVITGEYTELKTDIATGGLYPFELKRLHYNIPRDLNDLAPEWQWNIPGINAKEETPGALELPHVKLDLTYDKQKNIQKVHLSTAEGRHLQTLNFKHAPNSLHVSSSDGDEVDYQFSNTKPKRLQKISRPSQAEVNYTYQTHSKERKALITRKSESNGRFTDILYNKDNKVEEIRSPLGTDGTPERLSSFTYNKDSTEVIDALGFKKIYHHKNNKIVSIEHYTPDLYKIERFEWDKQGRLAKQSLENAQGSPVWTKSLTYNQEGRITKETIEGCLEKYNKVSSYSREFIFKDDFLVREQEDDGSYVDYIRDNKGQLKEKRTACTVTRYEYDGDGLLRRETTEEGSLVKIRNYKSYSQTPWGLPAEIEETISSPDEQCVTTAKLSYNPKGELLSQELYNGKNEILKAEAMTYDKAGRLLSKSRDDGSVEIYSYDLAGNLISKNSLDGTESFRYDFMNRMIGEEGGFSFTYDLLGRQLTKTTPEGNTTTTLYDALGRPIETKEPLVLNEYGQPAEPKTRYDYDLMDRVVKKQDPQGYVTETVFNVRGKPLMVSYPDGTREEHEYYPNGRTKRSLFRNNNSQEYEYDALGRLSRILDKDSQGNIIKDHTVEQSQKIEHPSKPLPLTPAVDLTHTEKVVNGLGQTVLKKTLTSAEGIATSKTFDALGRTVEIEAKTPFGQLLFHKKIGYTLNGAKAWEEVDGKRTRWVWGPMNRLEELVEAEGTSLQRKTSYKYNLASLSGIIKPDGTALHYTYDTAGRTKTLDSSDKSVSYLYHYDEKGRLYLVEDLASKTASLRAYDGENRIISETLSNGLKMGWEHDSGIKTALILPDQSRIHYSYEEDRLKRVDRVNAKGDILYSHSYLAYDEKGHLLQEEMILGLGSTIYLYNAEERIVSLASPYHKEDLAYDGRRLGSKNGASFKYDDLNQILQEDEKRYAYDDSGNRIADGSNEYRYNALNQLVKQGNKLLSYDRNGNLAAIKEGGSTTTFAYDALNRMTSVSSEGEVWKYSYDAYHRRVSKMNPDGSLVRYIYDGLNEIGAADESGLVAELKVLGFSRQGDIGGAIAVEINGEIKAALKDSKGSIVCLAGKYGAEKTSYTAFGESKEEFSSPWGYLGKRLDRETGFLFFGSRFYDPSSGRFVTCDPKGYADGHNLYHFARNNPNAYTDAYGHFAILDSFKSLFSKGWEFIKGINSKLNQWRDWLSHVSGYSTCVRVMEEMAISLLGKGFLVLSGFYHQEGQTGIFGEGEIDPKVRISFAHGILNLRSDLVDNLRQISNSHGGVNIHYVYRPTQGFAWDIYKCLMIKFGYVSQEAKEIIKIWKSLIEELGGTDGGGKIIHYAHSLGGSDTNTALSFLSVDEQKMIEIRSFGSATIIPDIGTYTVTNYVSKRDGVTLFGDPLTYLKGIFKSDPNVVYVGTVFGWPGVDHALSVDSYQEVIRALGQAFLSSYGVN